MTRVLFICGRNKLRSPTAEQIFCSWPGIEVASAGISDDAVQPVSPELLQWADVIFVMQKSQRSKLTRRFRFHLNGQRVICLNIPDKYRYMDERLVEILRTSVPRFLEGASGR